jgi:hypothetical protein
MMNKTLQKLDIMLRVQDELVGLHFLKATKKPYCPLSAVAMV